MFQRVTGLQRAGGNQAVAQAIGSFTEGSSIPVSRPEDSQEREAARAAEEGLTPGPREGTCGAGRGRQPGLAAGTSGGQPLDRAARELFETRFGMDLSGVRIHTGSGAVEAARSIDANAFTVRSDIVFDAGKYAPETAEGRRLLAHELAHVAQQFGAGNGAGIRGQSPGLKAQREEKKDTQKKASAKVPPGQFGPLYAHAKSRLQLPYATYKAGIGQGATEKAQAASDYGGRRIDPAKMEIQEDELREILNPPGKGHVAGLDKTIESYRASINQAFAALQLNTVEAQAVYLAHSAGETGSLAQLEERFTVREKSYASKGFPGRGPVQVTDDYNYIQTLAYLETFLEKLKKSNDPAASAQVPAVQEALDKIKADPSSAADPKYTFLFSAAFMHMSGGARRSANLKDKASFPGDADEDSWVNSRRNNKRELASAESNQKSLQALKDDPKTAPEKIPGEKQLKDAAGRVREANSVLERSKIKAAAYERAVRILSKKQVQGP